MLNGEGIQWSAERAELGYKFSVSLATCQMKKSDPARIFMRYINIACSNTINWNASAHLHAGLAYHNVNDTDA